MLALGWSSARKKKLDAFASNVIWHLMKDADPGTTRRTLHYLRQGSRESQTAAATAVRPAYRRQPAVPTGIGEEMYGRWSTHTRTAS